VETYLDQRVKHTTQKKGAAKFNPHFTALLIFETFGPKIEVLFVEFFLSKD